VTDGMQRVPGPPWYSHPSARVVGVVIVIGAFASAAWWALSDRKLRGVPESATTQSTSAERPPEASSDSHNASDQGGSAILTSGAPMLTTQMPPASAVPLPSVSSASHTAAPVAALPVDPKERKQLAELLRGIKDLEEGQRSLVSLLDADCDEAEPPPDGDGKRGSGVRQLIVRSKDIMSSIEQVQAKLAQADWVVLQRHAVFNRLRDALRRRSELLKSVSQMDPWNCTYVPSAITIAEYTKLHTELDDIASALLAEQ
jgi:hypothetical protein